MVGEVLFFSQGFEKKTPTCDRRDKVRRNLRPRRTETRTGHASAQDTELESADGPRENL